jgi:ribose transport system substrate-binding protein
MFVGFDSSQIFTEAIRADQLHGIVVQNPFNMGYLGVKSMVESLLGRAVEKRVDTGVTVVTKDNLESADIQTLIHPPLDQYLK